MLALFKASYVALDAILISLTVSSLLYTTRLVSLKSVVFVGTIMFAIWSELPLNVFTCSPFFCIVNVPTVDFAKSALATFASAVIKPELLIISLVFVGIAKSILLSTFATLLPFTDIVK